MTSIEVLQIENQALEEIPTYTDNQMQIIDIKALGGHRYLSSSFILALKTLI